MGSILPCRNNGETRDRGYTRQGLTPETVGGNALQLIHATDLAGGVAGDSQFQLFGGYAAAVVLNADEGLAAVVQPYVNAFGTGIEAVFNQFLDHAGRAFHHFASGDLVTQVRW